MIILSRDYETRLTICSAQLNLIAEKKDAPSFADVNAEIVVVPLLPTNAKIVAGLLETNDISDYNSVAI